jgi:hypothetical protein
MKQSSSSEGNNLSASQEIPLILRNRKPHTAFTSLPPAVPTQSKDARVPDSLFPTVTQSFHF